MAAKLNFCNLSKRSLFANPVTYYYYKINFSVLLPRYARINSMKTDTVQVEEELFNSGYELVSQKDFNSHHHISCGVCDKSSSFCWDDHIPGLLAFCSCAPLTDTPLYASGSIVLQDKVWHV